VFGLTEDQERVQRRLVAAGLPPQNSHTKDLVRAVAARLGGSLKGKLPEEIDAAVATVKARVPAVFDPDQQADAGANGYREFLARYPSAAAELAPEQRAQLERSDEAAEQVRKLLVDLGAGR